MNLCANEYMRLTSQGAGKKGAKRLEQVRNAKDKQQCGGHVFEEAPEKVAMPMVNSKVASSVFRCVVDDGLRAVNLPAG